MGLEMVSKLWFEFWVLVWVVCELFVYVGKKGWVVYISDDLRNFLGSLI